MPAAPILHRQAHLEQEAAVPSCWLGTSANRRAFLMDVSAVEQQEAAFPIPAVHLGTEVP